MKKSSQNGKMKEVVQRQSESNFSHSIVRVAVGQICQSRGLTRVEPRALETLTDIATRYLTSIAKLSSASANSDGRTQSNIYDIIYSLEELASVQGFPGNSNVRSRSVFASAVIKNLIVFVRYADEIPFVQPLPRRKIVVERSLLKRGDNKEWYSGGGMKHVPRWLPAVPHMERREEEEREKEVKWGCLC